jgi:DNA polymerase III epsilon subunit-like protein
VDVAVLGRELSDWSASEVFDTLKLARRLLPGLASYRLGALVQAFDLAAGLPPGLTPHRAMYDALATAALFIRLAASVSLAELRTLAPKGDGDEAATLF